MPPDHGIRVAARAAFHRWPRLQRFSFLAVEPIYRLALWPFRRSRRRGTVMERGDLLSKTDDYIRAAERYFAAATDTAYLLGKPFTDPHLAPKHLIDTGVLMQAVRLRPGDVVVELGAGTCWLSHMLNRYGCRTVAVDVSPTALELGRRLFDEDPRTDWTLQPAFVPYDGHSLPLPDGACDRILINDAFHHVPNQREVLLEMHRILKPDGVVGMSEPGAGHGAAAHSVEETVATGVLENELRLADLAALSRACGFRAMHVVVASPYALHEVPAGKLGAFTGGAGFAEYWKKFCGTLERHHYLLLYKGDPAPTTRRPGVLSARIDCAPTEIYRVGHQQSLALTLKATNLGDTVWLAEEGDGWTRLGAHLYRMERDLYELADFDWHRAPLPEDVPPGGKAAVHLDLPPISETGRYRVVVDLVIEGRTWFAQHGSAVLELDVRVD